MPSRRYVLPFLFSAMTTLASAAERQLGPHVHGQATVNVSAEGSALDVELSLPGHDAVGFEHPPASAAESAALAKATATVDMAAWLQPSGAAACTLATHSVQANGYGAVREPGGHADFDATYHFQCLHPGQLRTLDIRLIQAFPSVQKVVVNTITDEGSTGTELTGTSARVVLTP